MTLWCEHSGWPVPLLEGQVWASGAPGVYEFEAPREWLIRAAPVARLIGNTLSLMLETATAGIVASGVIASASKQLEFGQQTLDALSQTSDRVGGWVDDAGGDKGLRDPRGPFTANGAVLRELHAFLRERAPGFGGLEKVRDAQLGRYVWVHRRYRDLYDPPSRTLDQSDSE